VKKTSLTLPLYFLSCFTLAEIPLPPEVLVSPASRLALYAGDSAVGFIRCRCVGKRFGHLKGQAFDSRSQINSCTAVNNGGRIGSAHDPVTAMLHDHLDACETLNTLLPEASFSSQPPTSLAMQGCLLVKSLCKFIAAHVNNGRTIHFNRQ